MNQGKQILVVEDEIITAKVIQKKLISLGYNVPVTVASGEEAIKKVKENNPDLVLMDINLETKMDGIEAASIIRSFSNIPVIYLTTHSDDKTLERAKITEPYAYMVKPFEEKGLQINLDVIFFKHKIERINHENEALIQASKTKSEFMMAVTHELRTPLNAIIGFSEILKSKNNGTLNETQEKYVERIHSSGNNLLGIINNILDLSSAEAGKIALSREKISLGVLFNDVIDIVKESTISKKIQIKTEIDPGLQPIEADKNRVKQVIYNILNNSIKFSNPEGIISMTAKKEGDMAQVTISDRGIGIKEEDLRKLFNDFEQIDKGASRHYGGLGLGLVISKKLVDLHGGKIGVKSKYGEGTTITFSLPITAKS
ncbi:MAG: ATP-binding protein [Candidatus Methanoperedens sp.]|nr:ATP-binding protein [Candidatus Methanoperedens sp.]